MTFETLLRRYRGDAYEPPKVMLCLDPGFTTGVCVFKEGKLDSWEQVTTVIKTTKGSKLLWPNLTDIFKRLQPTLIVCEDYRVYQHKLNQHTNSSVDTLRLIGGIDMTADMLGIPIVYQMAMQAKGFCTDEKLKSWGYWQPGMRHSRDAIRHGCYYMMFNKEG